MKNQFWNNIIHILAGITLGFLMFGCKSSKTGCDAYSLQWSQEADSLTVHKGNKLYIPKTPAYDVKQIYFNNADRGEYVVTLLKNGKVVETKKININK
jgi:ABC-type uncharacterized transport system auxiliary subunit